MRSFTLAKKADVSTGEHVTDGPLSSGPHEVLYFVVQVRNHWSPNNTFFSLFLIPTPSCFSSFSSFSSHLSSLCLLLSLSFSLSIFLLLFALSVFPSLFRCSSRHFVLSRSFAQRTSRSRVGHTPVRVKVSSVPAPCFFFTFATPPPSAATTFRDTPPTHAAHLLPHTTAEFLDRLNDDDASRHIRISVEARRFLSADFFFSRDAKRSLACEGRT